MRCPVCKNCQLVEKSYRSGSLLLDRCESCKGVWFGKDELGSLLGSRAAEYFEIPRISSQIDHIRCPKCNEGMYELCYPGTTVFIEMCKSCRGIWLDHNEWNEINNARSNHTNKVVRNTISQDENQRPKEKNADNISGIKGSLLDFIESSIEFLTDF